MRGVKIDPITVFRAPHGCSVVGSEFLSVFLIQDAHPRFLTLISPFQVSSMRWPQINVLEQRIAIHITTLFGVRHSRSQAGITRIKFN